MSVKARQQTPVTQSDDLCQRLLVRHPWIKWLDLLFLILVLAGGWYAIFKLPYQYPPEPFVWSTSYRVGFNNRVSILATVAVLGLLSFRLFFFRSFESRKADTVLGVVRSQWQGSFGAMPRSLLWLSVGITIASTLFLYRCIPDLSSYFEAHVTLPKAELAVEYHLKPYTDSWWPYGPILFYLPVCFMQLFDVFGLSREWAYMAAVCVFLSGGVGVLFYLVNEIRVSVVLRSVLFVIMAFAMHIWSLGAQTAARFLLPYALLLLVHRFGKRLEASGDPLVQRKLSAACVGGVMLMMGISPEIGLVLMLSFACYFLHRIVTERENLWLPLAGGPIGFGLWLLLFPECFSFAGHFSAGAGCNPVVPAPHILLYLAGLFGVMPVVLRSVLARPKDEMSAVLMGWMLLVMATLPPSFSRCDPSHVVWNGAGIFILCFGVTARRWPRLLPVLASVMLLILSFAQHLGLSMGLRFFLDGVRLALAGKEVRPKETVSPLIEALGLDSLKRVAAPFDLDSTTRRYLIATRRLYPLYQADIPCMVAPAEVEKHMADLRKASYVLVPEGILGFRNAGESEITKFRETRQVQKDEEESIQLGSIYCYPSPIHSIRLGFDPDVEIASRVSKEFAFVKKANGWALLKNPLMDLP